MKLKTIPRPARRRQRDKKLTQVCIEIMAAEPAGHQVTFLHSAFCQVGLPRSKPSGSVFERQSGHAGMRLEAGGLWCGKEVVRPGLPYGTRPRLLLLHLMRTYLRTGALTLDLKEGLRDFVANTLGLAPSGGERGVMTAFEQQLQALAACRLTISYLPPCDEARPRRINGWMLAFDGWNEGYDREVDQPPWRGSVRISREFAASIRESSVPVDLRAVRAIQNSALSLDVYTWLAQRLHRLERPMRVTWSSLREQFGQEYSQRRNFKRAFRKSLSDVLTVYPQAKVESAFGGIRLMRSAPPVRPRSP